MAAFDGCNFHPSCGYCPDCDKKVSWVDEKGIHYDPCDCNRKPKIKKIGKSKYF